MDRVSWDDLNIAWKVASLGSLSKAGQSLGMNHATVLRHINTLEKALNVRLFLRHQRGYQLTDAGRMLVSEMPDIERRIGRLESLLVSSENKLTGPLLITTVVDHMPRITAALKAFRDIYPEVRLQVLATDDILPLSSGVTHVSLRMGPQPDEPDAVVRPLTVMDVGYYAAQAYIDRYGFPESEDSYNQHYWVMPSGDKTRIPFIKAILDKIDRSRLAYQSNNFIDLQAAVVAGMGIGPLSRDLVEKEGGRLRRLDNESASSTDSVWFAYHRDMKTNRKVQALYAFLVQHLSQD